jgi:hypothetical protein
VDKGVVFPFDRAKKSLAIFKCTYEVLEDVFLVSVLKLVDDLEATHQESEGIDTISDSLVFDKVGYFEI